MADKIIEKITSTSNSQVKDVVKLFQKKYRTESQKFIIEGIKPIEQAILYNYEIEKVFVIDTKAQKYSNISCKTIVVSQEIMKKISTTDSAPEIVAIAKQKKYSTDIFKTFKKIILLENIKDAGNIGTILRSAVAFGCEGIVLVGDTIDVYNPKVVRSTVGTMFMIPIVKINSCDIKTLFPSHKIYATKLHQNNVIRPEQIDNTQPLLLMFGSEAEGLSDETSSIADHFVIIEHKDDVESLNLSVAASIVLYEVFKN